MDIDLEQLRELMRALNEHDIAELKIEQGDERIVLRRGAAGVAQIAPVVHAASAFPSVPPPPAAATPAAPTPAEEGVFVTSPFVGTFYRAPSPGAEAFVKIDDHIAPGRVLCIVEAMKLMNEIEAEISGTILEVLVENGKPVEYGDRLFRVRPD